MAANSATGSHYLPVVGVPPSTSYRLCCTRAFSRFGDISSPSLVLSPNRCRITSRGNKRNTSICANSFTGKKVGAIPFPLKFSMNYYAMGCNSGQTNIRRVAPVHFLRKFSRLHVNSSGYSDLCNLVPRASTGPNETYTTKTAFPDSLSKREDISVLTQGGNSKTSFNGLLSSKLPFNTKLHRGQLENGLQYVILPNKTPPNRFDVAMEIHVGSVDEDDDEQGIAHLMEYVSFLGSKKGGQLLAAGITSSSYTDFHHTVFHVHSPSLTKDGDFELLPFVLDALNEIAFKPKFIVSHVSDVRRALLSEIQKINTLEYQVDCQLVKHLHSENKLSKRLPIGLEEKIKTLGVHNVKKFHDRWYYPANATLYIVGDIESIPKTVQKIGKVFGKPDLENVFAMPKPIAFDEMASFFVPSLPTMVQNSSSSSATNQSRLQRNERNLCLAHNWSTQGIGTGVEPQIFENDMLREFSMNMFCKIPINRLRTYRDMRDIVMKGIFLSAFHFRIEARSKESDSPFSSVELDSRDSGREGCSVITLKVIAEPKKWFDAVKFAVYEVRRLKDVGITKDEFARYMNAALRKSEDLAKMIDNVNSGQTLRYIMDSIELDHTVMDQQQAHESVVAVVGSITVDEVNSAGARMLEFISDFGRPTAPVPAAIVACIPTPIRGESIEKYEMNLSSSDIINAIKAGLDVPVEKLPEVEVPAELITASQIHALKEQSSPTFVPLPSEGDITKLYDEETGITQRYLSNGISVNYKVSKSDPDAGVMRFIIGGGRASEETDSKGAVAVGIRTLLEGGCVGNFTKEQVELYCLTHKVRYSMVSKDEYVQMEFRFPLQENGYRAAFELLHMILEHSIWLDDAFDKAKKYYISDYESVCQNAERSTSYFLTKALLGGDERLVAPAPSSLAKLTLKSVKEAVLNLFVGGNMEMNLVGDLSEEEIESYIVDYIGTVNVKEATDGKQSLHPMSFGRTPSDLQFQHLFLEDFTDSACAYIAGPAPNRWGFVSDGTSLFGANGSFLLAADMLQKLEATNGGKDVDRELSEKFRKHPLFCSITMDLLAEIINSRLLSTVEDSLKVADRVSFELNLFDRVKIGWYGVSVKSTPSKIYKTVAACMNVLRGLNTNNIAPKELENAKRTLLVKHEADMKLNSYWLDLMTHLQASYVPRKDISCIRDLLWLYEVATIEDIYHAYNQLKVDEDSIYCYIALSGSEILKHKFDKMMEKLEMQEREEKKRLPMNLRG